MTTESPAQTRLSGKHVAAVLGAASLIAPLTLVSEGIVTRTSPDPVSIPTGCAGHANAPPGKVFTLGECEQIAVLDLAKAGAGIAPCLPDDLPEQARAAFTDAAFNLGTGAFCRSSMSRKALAGDLAGACAALSLYVNAGGKPLSGLVTRRQRERNLCDCGRGDAAACEAAENDPATAGLVTVADAATVAPARPAAAPPPVSPPPRPVAAPKRSFWTALKDWLA